MDIKSIIEKIESAPQDIKNMIYSMLTNSAIAASNTEKEMFKVNDLGGYKTEVNSHINQEITEQNIREVINDMKEGVINENTKKYAKRFKDVLSLADEISEKRNAHLYFSNRFSEQNETARLLKEQNDSLKEYTFNTANKKTCINEYGVQFNKEIPKYSYVINFKTNDSNVSKFLTENCVNISGIDKGNNDYILKARFNNAISKSMVSGIEVVGLIVKNYNKEFFRVRDVILKDNYTIDILTNKV